VNENFWVGFEKNAGLGGFLGSLAGGASRAVRNTGSAIKSLPGKVKAIPGQIKGKMQHNKREFDVMRRKSMGIEGRKANNLAGKTPDLAAKAQHGTINTGKQSPSRAAIEAKKNSTFNKLKTVGQVGLVAGAGGVAMGSQGMDENAQR
jgi:hypothetical protein